jgi:hypothetical protein
VNEFLQGGTMAYANYKKLGLFLERWLVRNGKRLDDAICCIQYIGETSRTVEDQFLEEDNPKKRDGAGLQWEFFQWFGITIKFAMGYVALGNGQSKFIEAFAFLLLYQLQQPSVHRHNCNTAFYRIPLQKVRYQKNATGTTALHPKKHCLTLLVF